MCVILAGCGLGKPGVAIAYDDPLETKLNYLVDHEDSARLSDLTDFDWDEVHLFNEGAPREAIEQIVGSPVRVGGSSLWSGSLLVFEKNDAIIKAVGISGGYLRADHPSWPSDVLLEPWGLGYLRLTLPPPNERPAPSSAN